MAFDPSNRIWRPLDRRAFLRGALAASAGGAALYALGCGSDDGDAGATETAEPTRTALDNANATATGEAEQLGGITPSLLTTEFVVNSNNRFLVGLVDDDRRLVRDAAVHLKFYKLAEDGITGSLRGEGDARYVELGVEGAHAHDSSAGDAVAEDVTGFYFANVPFTEAGLWGAEVAVTRGDDPPSTVQRSFNVLEAPATPAIGTAAPASQNDTAATNPNTESLCSRDEICGLHDLVLADLAGKGRPFVVQFSTPAFCATRFCGPVLEVLLDQVPAYRDRIDFVHIEVFKDHQLQQYREAVQEWKLPGEPYTFFVDGAGTVRDKLEAIFTTAELTARLDGLLSA